VTPNQCSLTLSLGNDWLEEFSATDSEWSAADLVAAKGVVDIVVGARNVSSRIAADRVLPFVFELVVQLTALLGGQQKVFVAYPEEPWELVFVGKGQHCLMSLYRLWPEGELVLFDAEVPISVLVEAVDGLCLEVLTRVGRVAPHLKHHPSIVALFEARKALRSPGVGSGDSTPRTAPSGPRLELESRRGLLSLQLEATHPPDFTTFGSREHFDTHSLLIPSRVSILSEGERSVLFDGPGALMDISGLIHVLSRALSRPSGAAGLVTRIGGRKVVVTTETVEFLWDGGKVELASAALVDLLPDLVHRLDHWMVDTHPSQATNQRWIEVVSGARALQSKARQLLDGNLFGTPSRQDSLQASEVAQDIEFPFPVNLRNVKRMNCERKWCVESQAGAVGHVFVAGEQLLWSTAQEVRCLQRADGDTLWSRALSLGDELCSLGPGAKSTLVVGTEAICLVDIVDGVERWRTPNTTGEGIWPLGSIQLSPDEKIVVMVLAGRHVEAREVCSGRLLWEQDYLYGEVVALAANEAGNLHLVLDDGLIEARDGANGQTLWRIVVELELSELWSVGGHLLVWGERHSLESVLQQIDGQTGALGWTRVFDGVANIEMVSAAPLVFDRGGEYGSMEWECLRLETGETLWSRALEGEALPQSSALWSGHSKLFTKTANDRIQCFDLLTGESLWTVNFPNQRHGSDEGVLHLIEDVLLVVHDACYLIEPETGRVLCVIGGIESDPNFVVPLGEFDLLVGIEHTTDHSILSLYSTGHFLAVVE